MPDFRVTFKGDLGNLSQFDSAIKNSALSSSRALENANARTAASVGNIAGAFDRVKSGAGLFKTNNKTIVDSINNTFQHSGDVVRRFVSDYKTEIGAMGKVVVAPRFTDAYMGSYKEVIGNEKLYQEAAKKTVASDRELLKTRERLASINAAVANKTSSSTKRRDILQTGLDKPTGRLAIYNSERDILLKKLEEQQEAFLNKPVRTNLRSMNKTVRELQDLAKDIKKERLPIEAEINKINAALARLGVQQGIGQRLAGTRQSTILGRPEYAALDATTKMTPPINTNLANVLNESESLRKQLLKGGLGGGARYGTEDFQKSMAQQEASVDKVTRNMRTGLRTVQGSFIDANKTLNNFTVDLDDQGKVVGRWGGNLRGAGSILKQTVRDFQKVVEWTIATTVVFGTLAAVFSQFKSINELNNSLSRFAITAQTSAEETQKLFSRLAQVAYDTATPLKEIITVADDIALATRRAGQSTTEWQQDIIELTNAVGIFTNLTGVDTVEAADQLSSAFKQLGISPDQVVGVLSKVTAVAGGQANAIADIVKALSNVSEAAQAAGLSVDEQIASVQVLSQVTNKSAADIATAFKNLFGSISSVGSEKILGDFGIQIRDEAGGIKDFLDIYREVADAVEQGIIPQNRLPDVLRGISGGPRRAPDAAALLSNLPKIEEVIAKSVNASNEALIANSKVLDTNQAKITRFQNAIDTTVFERFGKSVQELVGFLTSAGTLVAEVFNGISPELVNVVLKLGAVVIAFRGIGAVLKLFVPGLIGGAIKNVKGLTVAFQEAGKYGKLAGNGIKDFKDGVDGKSVFGPTLPPAVGKDRLKNILKNNAGKLAIGGIAAGATGAAIASGKVDTNTIGTILQAGGAAATLVPGLQGIGLAAIVAGTAIQLFAGNSEDAGRKSKELASEVYTLSQRLRATQEEADNFAKTQSNAGQIIDNLRDKTNKTAEEQATLSNATADFVTATLGLAAANREVATTFDALVAKIPELSDEYQRLRNSVNNNTFTAGSPLLKEFEEQFANAALIASGQANYAGGPINFTKDYRAPNFNQGTSLDLPYSDYKLDLKDLVTNPDMLKDLFQIEGPFNGKDNPSYGQLNPALRPQIEGNDLAIKYIQDAYLKAAEKFGTPESTYNTEQQEAASKLVTELLSQGASITQNLGALAKLSLSVQSRIASGGLTVDQGANATAGVNLLDRAASAGVGNRLPRGEGAGFARLAGDLNRIDLTLMDKLIEKIKSGTKLTIEEMIKLTRTTIELEPGFDKIAAAGEDAIEGVIIASLKEANVSTEDLNRAIKLLGQDIVALPKIDISGTIDDAKLQANENFGQRAMALLVGENSGAFEGNAKGLALLNEQNEAALKSNLQLIDSMSTLEGTAFVDLNNKLFETIGLYGEVISQTELNTLSTEKNADGVSLLTVRQSEFGQTLIEAAVAAGVNAAGIRKITEKVAELKLVMDNLPAYKRIIISVETLYKAGNAGLAIPGVSAALDKKLRDAKALEEKAIRDGTDPSLIVNKGLKEIFDEFNKGTGSNFGQLPDKKPKGAKEPYNKPGLLDIPEEILAQSNYMDIINKAIKNATNLQKKVPGETKENKKDIVELLNGTKKILETRGVGEEYLRRALDELTGEIKKQNDLLAKADTIRRIRVGAGDFSALANVPLNNKSGISLGGPQGPITVNLNLSGQVLTPAQFSGLADQIASALKSQINATA